MAFKPMTFTTSNSDTPQLLRISNWGGVNQLATPSQIEDNESPDAQNIQADMMGAPDKRNGYQRVFATSLGNGQINGAYDGLFNGNIIFAWGTGLYTQTGSNQPVSIMAGLANAKAKIFMFNNKIYLINGTNYVVYDGTTAQNVTNIAYIPNVLQNCKPDGTNGSANEQWNLLSAGFNIKFNADGTSTAYKLGSDGNGNAFYTNLDATTTTCTVNGVTKVEGTDYTVNRTTGVFTFNVAPTSGQNNVVITAYKTQTGYANYILNCNIFNLFGGDNDTRLFLAGNPNYPNRRYHSYAFNPTYFPQNNYEDIGSSQTAIIGFSKKYTEQIIFKQHNSSETSIWHSSYYTDGNGNVTFPVYPQNHNIGCNASDTIIDIENNPTWLDSIMGVYQLVSTFVITRYDVQRISDKINQSLLSELNLNTAIGFLHKYRYGICVNGNCYVYDYRLGIWYGRWANINASCFFVVNGNLYFGSNSIGMIYQFSTQTNDDGVAIQSYLTTKYLNFGVNEYKKLLSRVFYTLKPSAKASVTVSFITNLNTIPTTLSSTATRRNLFSYNLIDYSQMTYATSTFPQESMKKVRAKKIVWVQFTYTNNNLNETMGLLSFGYQWMQQNIVKDS